MTTRDVTVVNRLGLHARAAARFVQLAGRFSSRVTVSRGEEGAAGGLARAEVDGKSILGLLTLAAARGNVLRVRAEGEDERQVLDALEELVRGGFGERE